MHVQVIFYSSTGNTRKAAQLLASALGVTALEVTCKAYSGGLLGGLRQAWDILTGACPRISVPIETITPETLLVVGCPVWAARPAPPMRTFLRKHARNHRNIAAFVTCGGLSKSYTPEKALAEMQKEIPANLQATGIFKEAEIDEAQFPQKVAVFADVIKKIDLIE